MNKLENLAISEKETITEIESLVDIKIENNPNNNIVIAIADICAGSSDKTLGKEIMVELINDLPRQETLPCAIVFYNSGVQLACDDSQVIPALEFLKAQDIRILVCSKSLKYFNLFENLQIGKPASIHELNHCLLNADYVIRP